MATFGQRPGVHVRAPEDKRRRGPMNHRNRPSKGMSALFAIAGALLGGSATAQPVTLRVHHFLPAASTAHQKFIKPWCNRIEADSRGKLRCQISPAMQLGGKPPELIDQVRTGAVDIIWTLPGYTPGRFPIMEVFELPFMSKSAEATSHAAWDYYVKH